MSQNALDYAFPHANTAEGRRLDLSPDVSTR